MNSALANLWQEQMPRNASEERFRAGLIEGRYLHPLAEQLVRCVEAFIPDRDPGVTKGYGWRAVLWALQRPDRVGLNWSLERSDAAMGMRWRLRK